MTKILIIGKSQAGKTTLANALVTKWGEEAEYVTGQTASEVATAANAATKKYVIIDFAGTTQAERDMIGADKLIWLDTVQDNSTFENPEVHNHHMAVKDAEMWSNHIMDIQHVEENPPNRLDGGIDLLPPV